MTELRHLCAEGVYPEVLERDGVAQFTLETLDVVDVVLKSEKPFEQYGRFDDLELGWWGWRR